MSLPHETQTLWARLRTAGAVSGDAPARNDGLPWYLAGLIGVSAWIAAALLLGFFVTLFDHLWKNPPVAVTAGALCIAAAQVLLRIARGREFFEQSAIALSLVGQLLLGMAFSEWFDDTVFWALIAAVALALYVAGAQTMHRFLCGAVFAAAVIGICNELDTSNYDLSQTALPALAWLAFAAWWRAECEDGRALPVSPLAWALSLAALLIAFFSGPDRVPPDHGVMTLRIWIVDIAVVVLLPLTVWRLAGLRRALPLLCAIAFALIWLRAPGVSLGAMLMLIAFASHRPALLATGLIGTGVYLIRYYYQMEVPLLEKSQWLLLGGLALLAIRFALARTAPRVDAGDRA